MARILRSQYAHAKIVSIDTSEAKKIPGVHAVVTAADAPDVRYGRSYIDRYILARNKVRFMGDPVAAVAADTPAIVKQALKKIKVVYEPLPVVIDPEEAMKPDAPTLHDDMPLPKNLPAGVKVKNVCGLRRRPCRRSRESDGRSRRGRRRSLRNQDDPSAVSGAAHRRGAGGT